MWISQRLAQDVHIVPHRPPSMFRVGTCAAAFHLSGSVLLGAQCFLLVIEPPHRQTSVLQGEEAALGVGVVL